jgi:hypothetical protein
VHLGGFLVGFKGVTKSRCGVLADLRGVVRAKDG